eukprot:jgi/Bigna1/86301/estExt_fgenesh1_pg.C_90234
MLFSSRVIRGTWGGGRIGRCRRWLSSLCEWPRHDHVPIYLVDAFTEGPFHGNPAAVCLLPDDVTASSRWMQNVAMEMNQAETAFVAPLTHDDSKFSLRWFTPVAEVDLCGHATLASAKVLFQERFASKEKKIEFQTRSGILTASDDTGEKSNDLFTLEFPSEPVEMLTDKSEIERVLSSLGDVGVKFVGRTKFDYFIELESEKEVREFQPMFDKIAAIGRRGTTITARASSPNDYVARFFAPQLGIPEDPVTGSAHCALGPYWGSQLGNKRNLTGFQASKRGGTVRVNILNEDRVELKGGAVVTMKGELRVLVL